MLLQKIYQLFETFCFSWVDKYNRLEKRYVSASTTLNNSTFFLAELLSFMLEKIVPIYQQVYRRSSDYSGLDLRCFKVTNAPHQIIKDNNIKAVKLDYCDQELQ